MRRARPRIRTAIGLALSLGSALPGCDDGEQAPSREPPLVVVDTPERDTVTVYLNYTGTLEASEIAEVRARVPGFLQSVEFEPSTNVEEGQLLFRIEPEQYEAQVREAEGAVRRAHGLLELASATLQRTRSAVDQGAVSEIELIEAEATVEQRRGELQIAAADLRRAQLDLGYTEVRAPIDGRIDEPHVDVGNLVGSGENTLLATIVRMDRVYAYFDVSESIALRYMERGDRGMIPADPYRAFVGLQNEDGWPHEGHVDYIDNNLDPNTGTITVRAVFDNADGELYPGLFARIRVPFEEIDDALLIDENALALGLEGEFVLVVKDDDTVERRPVDTGSRYEGRVHVTGGLDAGERYIVEGLQKARPGMPVRPRARDGEDADGGQDAEADGADDGERASEGPTDGG